MPVRLSSRAFHLLPLLFLILTLVVAPPNGLRLPRPASASETRLGSALPPVSIGSPAIRRSDLPAFGINVIDFQEPDVAKAKQAGAGSVLVGITWSIIEPVRTDPPTYDWSLADTAIGIAVRAGVEPFIQINGTPLWAARDQYKVLTADGRDRLAKMVAEAAKRYETRYPGKVRMWSFYNEPDCNGPTVPPEGDAPYSSCYGDFGAEYTKLLQAVYPAIKDANPNALVVMGGIAYDHWSGPKSFSQNFLDDVLASGGGNFFDLMNFHYYSEFADKWSAYGKDVAGKTAYIRGVMNKYGVNKPIIVTEIGKQAGTTTPGEAAQADYVFQGIARALAGGNDLILWYQMKDDNWNSYGMGLLKLDGTTKPSYTAFRVLSDKLTGLAASGCPTTDYAGVEAYTFKSADGSRWEIVAWSNDSSGKVMNVGAAQVVKTDRTGAATPYRDADDGSSDGIVKVPVGSGPVVLDLTIRSTSGSPSTAAGRVYLPRLGRSSCR